MTNPIKENQPAQEEWREQFLNGELRDKLEELFPKGVSKERGAALVLFAEMERYLDSEISAAEKRGIKEGRRRCIEQHELIQKETKVVETLLEARQEERERVRKWVEGMKIPMFDIGRKNRLGLCVGCGAPLGVYRQADCHCACKNETLSDFLQFLTTTEEE